MGTNFKKDISVGSKESIQLGNNYFTEGKIENTSTSAVIDLVPGDILARDASGNIVKFEASGDNNTAMPIGFNTDYRTVPVKVSTTNGKAVIKVVTAGRIDADVVKFGSGVDWDTQITFQDSVPGTIVQKTFQQLVESLGFEIEFGKHHD